MTLTIVGLGPGAPAQLTAGVLEVLKSGRPVLLRTAIHPTVNSLREMGIHFETCDDLYQSGTSFEQVYRAVADRVLSSEDLVFAVPGHPLVGEETVRLIRQEAPDRVEIISGPSFLDSLLVTLGLDPVSGLELLDALQIERRSPTGDLPAVIMQVHSRAVASDVKLSLMERYPDDHSVTLVRAAGVPGEERRLEMALHELDHHAWVDYLTTLYVPPLAGSDAGKSDPRRWVRRNWPADPLVDVMATLRGPDGCPWDREQTHRTLGRYMLEEAYEAVEAIGEDDPQRLCEELGDVLLQVVFHAQMAREAGTFDFHDVVQGITEKLIRRHPHIFGEVKAETPEEVTRNWDAIKQQEKGETARPASTLEGVSTALPALTRAFAIQRKAAKAGFDWETADGPAAKVKEELDEVLEASPDTQAEEIGDLLFAAVNLARMLKVDPETALTHTTAKFARRFRHIETRAAETGRNLAEMTLDEMDQLWDEAKRGEEKPEDGKK